MINNKLVLIIVMAIFLLLIAHSWTSAEFTSVNHFIEQNSDDGNYLQADDDADDANDGEFEANESPIPTDIKPIETKEVVIIPFGSLKPSSKESVEIARGVEILTSYYLDFYYKFSVSDPAYVANLLTNIALPPAPGIKEAREIAFLADADYVIFGNVNLSAPNVLVKGSWYDVENDEILCYVEETASISMLMRGLTNFSRQLAYSPSINFNRGDIEKKAEKQTFCKYINSFRNYIQAYLHYIRYELDDAEKMLDKAIELEPDFTRAMVFKAHLLLMASPSDPAKLSAHMNKINMLIEQLEKVKTESANDFRLYWVIGKLVFINGKAEAMKAHDYFLKSYLLRNNWLAAYHDIIFDSMPALMTANKFYRNPENIYKAAKDIQKIFPDNPDAMYVLAKIYWKLGLHDKASEVLQNIIELHPNYHKGYLLLLLIHESRNPHRAYEIAATALGHFPFDYQIQYQTFIALLKTAFNGMDLDEDKKHITLDEIKKVNNRDLPEGREFNIYKRIPFGFNEKHFDKYDLNKDKLLDEIEFIKLLAHYGVGPVECTKKTREDEITGINMIADNLWHHALICYALQGIDGEAGFEEDITKLKEFINTDTQKLEEYYEFEKIYTEIVSDETLAGSYNINNPLSHLIIYWGLAKNYKGYKSVASVIGKKFLKKKQLFTVTKPKLPLKFWCCTELNLFLYPDRTALARFAPKDLPDYEFKKAE